jgi:hypothetical protein
MQKIIASYSKKPKTRMNDETWRERKKEAKRVTHWAIEAPAGSKHKRVRQRTNIHHKDSMSLER